MMEKEGENDNDGHDKQTSEQTWQIWRFWQAKKMRLSIPLKWKISLFDKKFLL